MVTENGNEWYEDVDENDTDDGYSFIEYDITSSPNDFNIKTLFDFMSSGALVIPGFQRNFVWDIKRASKLIESIIMGLPIPQIFLYEKSRNEFLVIDGQQRLMSVYYFIKQRFPRDEKRLEIRNILSRHKVIPDDILHKDEYFTKFNLTLPETMPNQPNPLHKRNYATLEEYKSSFDMRTIRNIIIKQNTPDGEDSSVYEIFNRLNSGGINLTPQEIRASMYHSKFYEMLNELNMNEHWRRFLKNKPPDLHMKDIEILLRSFAILVEGNNYKPSMKKFLNRFSKICKRYDEDAITYFKGLFESFLTACETFEDNAFFGKKGNRFNISMFESIFAVACRQAYQNQQLIKESIDYNKIDRLKNNDRFIEACRVSTTNSSKVNERIQIAASILQSEN